MKVYTSKRITLIISIILTVLHTALMFLSFYAGNNIFIIVLLSIVFFVVTYFAILYIVKNYISEKIRPVYKIIKDLPLSEKKMNQHLENKTSHTIAEIKSEVNEWAKNQVSEIERLKELERYRKEFVGNVSHELKTPIFNIQGYILTLLEGGIHDNKINKLYLQRTEKSIDRMISIVEDLESISKLEYDELKLDLSEFDIVQLTKDVAEMEYWQAVERKIDIKIIQPEKPVRVYADKKRITEVLSNLIVNAVKYGKKGGLVEVTFDDIDEHITVSIEDNGIGIEKDQIRRIFERFYRIDKSRSREQGGTGLGLSIVKHIIEAHNQSINVKSVVDKGTTFTFTLNKAPQSKD